jgi:hypothetical protein
MLTVGIDEIHYNLAAILIDLCGMCKLLAEPAPDRCVEFKLGIYLLEHRVKAGVVAALSKLTSGALLPLPKVTSVLRPTILLRISFPTLEAEPERRECVAGVEPARPVSNNVLAPPAPKKNDLLARLAVGSLLASVVGLLSDPLVCSILSLFICFS